MNVFKKSLLVLGLATSLMLPLVTQALTYDEIVNDQTDHKGQVLGAVTPSPDINNDGIVNSVDMSIVLGHMGQNYAPADLNNDGMVNSVDFSILSSWYFAKK